MNLEYTKIRDRHTQSLVEVVLHIVSSFILNLPAAVCFAVIDIFMAFYFCKTRILKNIANIKRLQIKDGLQYLPCIVSHYPFSSDCLKFSLKLALLLQNKLSAIPYDVIRYN